MNVFMNRAFNLARASMELGGGTAFAAVIVKDRVIIAEGVNRCVADHDPTAHAEMVALRAAGQVLASPNLSGCELYTTCVPCPMCAAAIWWARIGKVIYSAGVSDLQRGGIDVEPLAAYLATDAARRIGMSRMEIAAGSSLFEEWFNSAGYASLASIWTMN